MSYNYDQAQPSAQLLPNDNDWARKLNAESERQRKEADTFEKMQQVIKEEQRLRDESVTPCPSPIGPNSRVLGQSSLTEAIYLLSIRVAELERKVG